MKVVELGTMDSKLTSKLISEIDEFEVLGIDARSEVMV